VHRPCRAYLEAEEKGKDILGHQLVLSLSVQNIFYRPTDRPSLHGGPLKKDSVERYPVP